MTDSFLNRGWINVNVNNPSVRTELFRIVCHSIIKARTNGKDHIRLVHGLIGFIKPMHAEHSDKLIIRSWEGSQSHQGIRDGIAKTFSQSNQFS